MLGEHAYSHFASILQQVGVRPARRLWCSGSYDLVICVLPVGFVSVTSLTGIMTTSGLEFGICL
jgi:hypothetical protein